MASTTDSTNENNNAPRLTPLNLLINDPMPNMNVLNTTFYKTNLSSQRRYNATRNNKKRRRLANYLSNLNELSNKSSLPSSNESSYQTSYNSSNESSNESSNKSSYQTSYNSSNESLNSPPLSTHHDNTVPITGVPITGVPITDVPITGVPITDIPITDVPITDVPNTSGISLYAKAFLLHTNETHSLLSSDLDIPSLLNNIDTWIRTANTQTKLGESNWNAAYKYKNKQLGEYISNAVTHLVQANITDIKKKNPTLNTMHFNQIIAIVQDNIETTIDKWENMEYTGIMQTLFGITNESNLQFLKKKGAEKEITIRTILEGIPTKTQCDIALSTNNSKSRSTCWLCTFPIKECNECEHKLSIKNALEHLNLIQSAITYRKLNPDYKKILQEEYAPSHKCCNRPKNSLEFIIYNYPKNHYHSDLSTIEVFIDTIIKLAKTKKDRECHCSKIAPLKHASSKMILNNIIKQLEPICAFMNAQVASILQIINKKDNPTIEQYHAHQIYQMFIKFRFLSQIKKSKWIKLITDLAINLQAGRKSNAQIEINREQKQSRKKKSRVKEGQNNESNNKPAKRAKTPSITSKKSRKKEESGNENERPPPKKGKRTHRISKQHGGAHLTPHSEIMFLCVLQNIPDNFYSTVDELDISLDDIQYYDNDVNILFTSGSTVLMTMNKRLIFAMYHELKTELNLKKDTRWSSGREMLNKIYRSKRDAVLIDLQGASPSKRVTLKKKLSPILEEPSSPMPALMLNSMDPRNLKI
jgi:hypothetical protein